MKRVFLIFLLTLFLPKWTDSFINLRELLFPSNPQLTRVRDLSEARSFDGYAVLDFIGLVSRHGYPAEEHNITTEDGYILKLHRIPDSPSLPDGVNKPCVYIQHGFLASSDMMVQFGPGKDLAFLLADAGYDVWIGNARGNSYGRSHVELTPEDAQFWNFSFHEIAIRDVSAIIDYILDKTSKSDLFYIGHSMGTTLSYTLLSEIPQYNSKIRLIIALSPVAYWSHEKRSPLLDFVIENREQVKKFLIGNEITNVGPQSDINGQFAKTFCSDGTVFQNICIGLFFLMSGPDRPQLNASALPNLFSYYPAGASTKTMLHFLQNIGSGEFNHYDYGGKENYNRYDSAKSPSYDIKKVTAPVALFYAHNDAIIKEEDVMLLKKKLPNIVLCEEVPYPYFGHLDFLWALNAKDVLYDRLLDLIQQYR